MQRKLFTDPFFYNQPELEFIDELKSPFFKEKPDYYGKRSIEKGEVDARGIYIAEKFIDDPDNLLETIYNDFDKFINLYEIGGKKFPVYLKKGDTECFEAYILEITEECVTITANDTEGIRRALIWLEDELRRQENAYLKPQVLRRKPYVRSRITRCFFSPINRPPKFGDELYDDIDYYPDEYLNRLMHDGSNGVWIYTRFSDLLPSDILTEYGKDYEKRMAKLNKVIEKCRRYGVGVYVFAIEPMNISPEMAKKYPDLAGDVIYNGNYTFCCSSEIGKAYCYEAGKKLLELAPNLRGLISITNGERATNCASGTAGKRITLGRPKRTNCPRCKKLTNGEILANALECLKSGTREINPDFEVVSWTYGHGSWDLEDIEDYVERAPSDVMLMPNLEDMGMEEQLGKVRVARDYWLSYIGPSDIFTTTGKKAMECGKHLFAKTQICCSHEIATVPYIPVPGNIYDKYTIFREYGVEGVMQCWYFGNYPSIMSKAAGELSFVGEFNNKYEFLENLAGVYFGRTKAKAVAKAWKLFEEGYKNYPINIMFSYYGPMHDSVVWKLALLPRNFMLARTWQLVDPMDGDRITDSFLTGHTFDEVRELCEIMSSKWKEGMKQLYSIDITHSEEKNAYEVARAIDIIIDGGRNILEFYYLRDQLGRKEGNPTEILERMRELVNIEKQNSLSMIPLCESCKSLGYHSEAEGYKFFPEKLRDRVSYLDELLNTEFVEVEERIKEGKSPLEYYDGVEDFPIMKRYSMPKGEVSNAKWDQIGDSGNHKFRMSYDDTNLYIELYSETTSDFIMCPEFRLMVTDAYVYLTPAGECYLDQTGYFTFQVFGEREKIYKEKYKNIKVLDDAPYHLILTLKLEDFGLDKARPMKLRFKKDGEVWSREPEREYAPDKMPRSTLGKHEIIPDEFGWIIPEE